jgi:CheY-like chemotaxis protein
VWSLTVDSEWPVHARLGATAGLTKIINRQAKTEIQIGVHLNTKGIGEMARPKRTSTESAILLVVDDDHEQRKFCGRCLSRNGFRVLEGDDGLEALLIAMSHGRPIDVLITDVELPSIRGTELGKVFKLIWPRTKVLYISGSSDAAIHSELELDGTLLSKPFSPEALVKSVGRMLSAR